MFPSAPRTPSSLFWWASGLLLTAGSAALLALSFSFEHGAGHAARPIVAVVAVLLVLGAVYAAAGLRALRDPPPLGIVLGFAVLCRALLVPSRPIQEDDVYRYIWDGRVAAAGLDPFAASPEEIDRFEAEGAAPSAAGRVLLGRLSILRQSDPGLEVVFDRINNRAFHTIYPALAQGLFRLHGELTPRGMSPLRRVVAMKAILAALDLGTLAALLLLLRAAGKPAGLSVLYAWCPLVLKEVANSGHMDALPALFLVLGLLALAGRGGAAAFFCGAALGAAFAAKLFALLVLPVALRALGARRALAALLGFTVAAAPAFLAWPGSAPQRAETLRRFALEWEMNDALFPFVEKAWGAVAPEAGSRETAAPAAPAPDAAAPEAVAPAAAAPDAATPWPDPHALALATSGALVLGVVLALAARTRPGAPLGDVLRRAFLVLAAPFLLGPLGFPWYFLVCVPLLPWARARSWLLLPGLLALYYVRFWLDYNWPEPLLGFDSGAGLFDWVVAPVELGLFYLALGIEAMVPWARRRAA